MEKAQRIWTRDEIINYISTNDKGLINGLMLLYNLQTRTEQQTEHSQLNNKVGFNSPDSKKLTSMAHQFIRTKSLSTKQINFIRAKLLKYSNQLTKIANKQIIVSL